MCGWTIPGKADPTWRPEQRDSVVDGARKRRLWLGCVKGLLRHDRAGLSVPAPMVGTVHLAVGLLPVAVRMLTGFGASDDPYAAGWERGYLDALSDVSAEVHRIPDIGCRQKLQQLLVSLTTQMRFLVSGAEQ